MRVLELLSAHARRRAVPRLVAATGKRERDAAPSAADDGAAGVHGRQPRPRQHHLPRLRLRLLPPLLGTEGTVLASH